jgi:hypothetical protein
VIVAHGLVASWALCVLSSKVPWGDWYAGASVAAEPQKGFCMGRVVGGEKKGNEEASPFFSPKELASRWACSRSSVARILKRARIGRVLLGMGKNGMVRYPREEVIIYEMDVRAKE